MESELVMAAPGLDPGVDPAIHALAAARETWMPGLKPGMTVEKPERQGEQQ